MKDDGGDPDGERGEELACDDGGPLDGFGQQDQGRPFLVLGADGAGGEEGGHDDQHEIQVAQDGISQNVSVLEEGRLVAGSIRDHQR